MLFNSLLLSALFLAGSAVAAADRPLKHQKSRIAERSTNTDSVSSQSNKAMVSLSGTSFSSMTGTFVTPSTVTGQIGSAFLIGISLTCQDYLLLAGVQYTITNKGLDYKASLMWPPDLNYALDSISISPHDTIELSFSGTFKTGAILKVKNLSTKQDRHQKYPPISLDCAEQTASWMIQNVTDSAMPNFGTVKIQGHVEGNGKTKLAEGSRAEIQGVTHTSVSGDTITFRYL